MDSRFLQSLIIVIETGSIAAAARSQNLTAAAVSQRVKSLENALGCRLLSRTGHSAKATQACLQILPRLKRIVAEVDAVATDLDSKQLRGELRVGVISTLLSTLLPRCVQYLADSAPNLLLQIVPGTSKALYQQLQEQQLDLAILIQPPFEPAKVLRSEFLFAEPLALIGLQPSTDIIQSISRHAFIQYDKSAWGGSIANSFLVDKQISVTPLCEIDSLESIALMVKMGMGVSLVPHWQGLQALASNLQISPIEDSKYQRNIQLLTHRQSGREQLIAEFKRALDAV
ncbi:MAG: transcriptional regulator, LysR-family protein [Osedax symbiont Rs2]|nr:MAG: transcriptional regulator, LysR-family protein [Osedax symbiont Rs2]